MTKVNDDLKKSGVFSVKYYYKNKPLIGNIFTVCALLSEENKILARGISICSLKDSHNKKIARKLSRNRALSAFFNRKNSEPICYDEFAGITEIKKIFKCKPDEERLTLEKIADSLGLPYSFGPDKMFLYIPYSYPMDITKLDFDWKSEFNPKPTEDEKKIFRMKEE